MAMQKHPLLTVKEAAQMLRLDERSVRERLINGQLKGEKKNVGLREKWFVFSGSVEAALQKEGFVGGDSSAVEDVTVESEAVDTTSTEAYLDTEDADDWIGMTREKMKLLAEEIVKPLMERIESQTEVISEQKRLISDQERQLRLLPDLEKQAEEERKAAELKELEAEALRKQVAAMQAIQTKAEESQLLAEEEIQRLKAEKEAEAKALEEENEQLRKKAEEAASLAADVQSLKSTVEELKRPLWKKWFLPKPLTSEKDK